MRASDPGSRTMYLSSAERPVFFPVSTTIGPPSASTPSRARTASVTSAATPTFRLTRSPGLMPCAARSGAAGEVISSGEATIGCASYGSHGRECPGTPAHHRHAFTGARDSRDLDFFGSDHEVDVDRARVQPR